MIGDEYPNQLIQLYNFPNWGEWFVAISLSTHNFKHDEF